MRFDENGVTSVASLSIESLLNNTPKRLFTVTDNEKNKKKSKWNICHVSNDFISDSLNPMTCKGLNFCLFLLFF